MHQGIIILTFTLFSLLVSCQTAHKKMDQDLRPRKIDSLMQRYFQPGQFNGVILVGEKDSLLYAQAFGLRDPESGDSLELKHRFYLASVSKSITALSLLMLVEDGKCSLGDSLSDYFPDLPFADKVKLKHLLSHTSGIPDYYSLGKFKPGMTNADVYEVIRNESLEFEPGERYAYSNSAYVLVSMLVEKISGEAYYDFLQKRLFDPVGMDAQVVQDSSQLEMGERAIGFGPNGEIDDYYAFTTGGGGIFANAEAVWKYDRALYEGKIISPALMEKAYQSTILKDGEKSYYGLGWKLHPDHPGRVSHDGALAGFRTYLYRDLGKEQVVIMFTNNRFGQLEEILSQLLLILNPPSVSGE